MDRLEMKLALQSRFHVFDIVFLDLCQSWFKRKQARNNWLENWLDLHIKKPNSKTKRQTAYCNENFFSFKNHWDTLPAEFLKEFNTRWIVYGGRWMCTEKCPKAFTIWKRWWWCTVTDNGQIVHFGRFSDRRTDDRTTAKDQQFYGTVIDELIQWSCTKSWITLFAITIGVQSIKQMDQTVRTMLELWLPNEILLWAYSAIFAVHNQTITGQQIWYTVDIFEAHLNGRQTALTTDPTWCTSHRKQCANMKFDLFRWLHLWMMFTVADCIASFGFTVTRYASIDDDDDATNCDND